MDDKIKRISSELERLSAQYIQLEEENHRLKLEQKSLGARIDELEHRIKLANHISEQELNAPETESPSPVKSVEERNERIRKMLEKYDVD